jgi:hypothetical protein
MLRVIMLKVIMLNVANNPFMLSVIMLNVAAPFNLAALNAVEKELFTPVLRIIYICESGCNQSNGERDHGWYHCAESWKSWSKWQV